MTTSLTPSLSELVEDETRIPEDTLVFLRERLRTMLHQLALREFMRQSKARGLTRSSLAKKLGRGPELVGRWLGRPGNREVDTVSDLLAAMGIVPLEIRVAHASDLVAAEQPDEEKARPIIAPPPGQVRESAQRTERDDPPWFRMPPTPPATFAPQPQLQ